MKTVCEHRIGTSVTGNMILHVRVCECGKGCTGFRTEQGADYPEEMTCCTPENHPAPVRELQPA